VCAAIAACNFAGLSDDQRTALQYLMRASSLLVCAQRGDGTAQTRCAQLQALTPRRPPPPSHAAVDSGVESLEVRELHGRLQHALAASGAAAPGLSDAAGLLAREEANSYGVMAPPGPDGQRRLRGGAVYAAASRINHECLPNVARFDAFDAAHPGAAPGANTAVHFRALHALPPGEELTQSYFPLTWSYQERQRRCAEHYGFACSCPRCREEASWPDGVRADRDAGAGEDGLAAHPGSSDDEDGGTMQDAGAATNPADAAYIHVFLFKYVCPRPGCEGTMAPAAPRALTMSCNVCGGQRSDADFLAELEQDMRAGQ
jgi:SET and MYND domain-containing protein